MAMILHHNANSHDVDDIMVFLKHIKTSKVSKVINHKNKNQHTLLMVASSRGRFDTVKYLVQHNCMINEQDNGGLTALIFASSMGRNRIAKYLIDNGALLELKDEWGQTALFKAAMLGHFKILKYLIKHNAIINTGDIFSNSSLKISYANDLKKIVFKRIKIYKK